MAGPCYLVTTLEIFQQERLWEFYNRYDVQYDIAAKCHSGCQNVRTKSVEMVKENLLCGGSWLTI